MSESENLIVATQAIPETDNIHGLPALNYSLKSTNLICFLGQRFNISNIYMQMLAGLSSPQSGEVEYFNCEKSTQIAKHFPAIAYLSHDSALLSVLNGLENVKLPALYHQLGTKQQIEKQAQALLDELSYGANHKVLPDFMTVVQKRHLLIARAIILEPKLLFIENPFAGLEFAETRMIEDYLYSLVDQKNITVIASNPNLGFVENYADKIILQSSSGFHFFNDWDRFYFHKQRNKLRF